VPVLSMGDLTVSVSNVDTEVVIVSFFADWLFNQVVSKIALLSCFNESCLSAKIFEPGKINRERNIRQKTFLIVCGKTQFLLLIRPVLNVPCI
jgi:uncharacterized membrane protein